jgi:hypothetical protein
VSRWTELATWAGPTPNQTPGHVECRGLVVHIASGYYEGTIAWEKNPDANVSSHFVLGRDGRLAQLVDTANTAWTQRDGNGHWLSVECEGFSTGDPQHATHPGWETLTAAQMEKVAQLLVRGHSQYGYPLTLAGSPTGKGLGYHSMGAEHGYNWGHLYCPGEPIKAQLPAILARAQQLAGGTTPPPPANETEGPSMYLITDVKDGSPTHGAVFLVGDNHKSYWIHDPAVVSEIVNRHQSGAITLGTDNGKHSDWWRPWTNTAGQVVPGVVLTGWSAEVDGPIDNGTVPVEMTDEQIEALAEKLAVALPAAPSAKDIATAVNDDAAARLAE